MIYEFEVIGDIKGKERPRINTYTCTAYTPNNTKDYENLIKQYFKIKYPRYVPLENRVSVKIMAYFKIPKSTTKKDKTLISFISLNNLFYILCSWMRIFVYIF